MLTIRKTVHILFGFPKDSEQHRPLHRCRSIPSTPIGGLRLIACENPYPPQDESQEDASSRGLHAPDHNNLSMCTEPLGSESCDGEMFQEVSDAVEQWGWGNRRQIQREETERTKRKLPPPLPWIVGHRSRFMKAERCSGRIRLIEVEIEKRPEMMRAFRENGRLRLELVGEERDRTAEMEMVVKSCQEEVNDMWGQKAQQQRFVTAA